jgi:hypothetical protein
MRSIMSSDELNTHRELPQRDPPTTNSRVRSRSNGEPARRKPFLSTACMILLHGSAADARSPFVTKTTCSCSRVKNLIWSHFLVSVKENQAFRNGDHGMARSYVPASRPWGAGASIDTVAALPAGLPLRGASSAPPPTGAILIIGHLAAAANRDVREGQGGIAT